MVNFYIGEGGSEEARCDMSYDSDSVKTVVAITNNKQHPSSPTTLSSASMNEKLLEDTKQKMRC